MAVFCDVVLVFWSSIRRLRIRWCSKILIQVASYLYVNYTNRNANIAIIDHRLDALLFANHSDGCSSSFLGMYAIVFVCLLVCLLFVRTRLVLFALYMLLRGISFTVYLQFPYTCIYFIDSFSAACIPIDTSGYLLLYI